MQGPQLDADQALVRLREGNRRFVDHVVSLEALLSHARREDHARAQRPFAVVLGCSDSRAPAEFVFDQGLGDLFVHVAVWTPTELTKDEKAALEKLRNSPGFQPRPTAKDKGFFERVKEMFSN